MKRSESLKRTGSLKRGRKKRPPEGPLTREQWEREVFGLDRGVCRVTGKMIHIPRPDNHHHVVPKQLLRRDGRHDIVFHPDNGILLTTEAHANHESAARRVKREELPTRCFIFAEDHGYGWYLDRTYD